MAQASASRGSTRITASTSPSATGVAVLVVLHLEAHDRGVGLEALLALEAAPLDRLAGAPGADDVIGAARRREAVAEREARVAVARLDLGAAVAGTALDLVRLWRAAAGHKPAAPADKLGVARLRRLPERRRRREHRRRGDGQA